MFFLEGICWNILAQLVIHVIPFKYSCRLFGKKGIENSFEITTNRNKGLLIEVMRASKRVFREVPWEVKCYDKALTIKWMLGKRGIKSTIYFGVAKNPDNTLKAHAWLNCGNKIICGNEGIENFTVVSYFT